MGRHGAKKDKKDKKVKKGKRSQASGSAQPATTVMMMPPVMAPPASAPEESSSSESMQSEDPKWEVAITPSASVVRAIPTCRLSDCLEHLHPENLDRGVTANLSHEGHLALVYVLTRTSPVVKISQLGFLVLQVIFLVMKHDIIAYHITNIDIEIAHIKYISFVIL